MFRSRLRLSLMCMALLASCLLCSPGVCAQQTTFSPTLSAPIAVYSRLSTAPASAVLDQKQLLGDISQIARLRKAGVRLDYDLADIPFPALAATPKSLGSWIASCRAARIRPGLRFSANSPGSAPAPPQWSDSLSADGHAFSLFEGSYLAALTGFMQSAYNRGVRLFELNALDLAAATPATSLQLPVEQVAARNARALGDALIAFRQKNRGAVVLVFPIAASLPASSLLAEFRVQHIGQPQLSAAPQADLQRSIDIESNDRVRRLEQSGVSLRQIDSSGFTVTAGAAYGPRALRSTSLLAMARGGWVNSMHGDLALIHAGDAAWLARAQRLFFALQARGGMHSFGSAPGARQPYGFAASSPTGSLDIVLNPGQSVATLALPHSLTHTGPSAGRIQFRDNGFVPRLAQDAITLGPGQMAVVGYGAYAAPQYNLGVDRDVVIPSSIESVDADFQSTSQGGLEARINPPMFGVLRVIVRPRADQPAIHDPAAKPLTLKATQYGRSIPLRLQAESGLSWAVGEIDVNDLTPGVPVIVSFRSEDKDSADLEASAFQVVY